MLWPRVAAAELRIILGYTGDYTAAAREAIKPKLKINWQASNADTSHQLSEVGRRPRLRQQRLWNAAKGLGRVSQTSIFDSETPLPDEALARREKTLLGFDARYARVHDQLVCC